MKFKINKFAGFREICDFFLEVGKFSDSKLENSENFNLGIGFFSNFLKKVANFPETGKFIYSEIHLSEF